MTDLAVLEAAMDALVARFGGDSKAEALRAREEHACRTGRVFEDDELYEARTLAFLEWLVLERPCEACGVPPVIVALREGDRASDLWAAWRALAASHRSIFVVEELPELHEGRLVVADMVAGGRFTVVERRRLPGVALGDVVEARLIGWAGKVRFGKTFCYHPPDAREAIAAAIRRTIDRGGSRLDAVDHVATLRVKALRYRHVAPARVYAEAWAR